MKTLACIALVLGMACGCTEDADACDAVQAYCAPQAQVQYYQQQVVAAPVLSYAVQYMSPVQQLAVQSYAVQQYAAPLAVQSYGYGAQVQAFRGGGVAVSTGRLGIAGRRSIRIQTRQAVRAQVRASRAGVIVAPGQVVVGY